MFEAFSELTKNPLIGSCAIGASIVVAFVAIRIQKLRAFSKIPPLLVAASILIFFIESFDFGYENYAIGGDAIAYLLGPATIALAFPLYKYRDLVRRNILKIAIAVVVSGLASIVTTELFCHAFGVDAELTPALCSKCVTTPVAIEISKMLGALPELSVCAVFVAGMFGAFCGHAFLRMLGLKKDVDTGIVMGAISHVIGTAKCLSKSQIQGALAGITLVLCALWTAIIALIIYT